MKCRLLKRGVAFAALGLAIFLAPAPRAQDTDSVRVVRLSRAEGQVLISHAGSDTWEEAPVNLTVQEGDTLETQGGLAEVEFENGATAYLAENSVLQFSQLNFTGGARATELSLTQGAGTFYANLTAQDSFRVRTLTLDVTIPERAEFRVDGFRDGAAVQVLLGNVTVSTTKGSTDLEKGQSVAVHEKDFQDFSIGRLPNPDDFDQWVTEEGEIIRDGNKNTLTYINSPNSYGLSDLSIYGTWVNLPGYGFSWRPFSVGFSWTPYFNGKWILDARLGWIWVSSEPWGWMPYHFGSWLLSPTLGWVWVPGGPAGLRRWEPARVNWLNVGSRVGWVAMSPNDRNGGAANAAQGVITKTGPSSANRTSVNRNEMNEIISSKDLRGIAPLRQPPAAFASRPAPPTRHVSNGNESIVYDRETHAFINTDGRSRDGRNNDGQNGRDWNQPARGNATPPHSAFVPPSNSGRPPMEGRVGDRARQEGRAPATQTEIPRVILPSGRPTDSRTNRVLLPTPYPVAPAAHGNLPSNGTFPARPPMNPPVNTESRPNNPIAPRPVAPAPTTVPQPLGARTGTQPPGSGGRPVAPTPPPASRPAPPDRR
jgi:hypothetical protein